jgi:pyruvate-formate lyase-activating enzyme
MARGYPKTRPALSRFYLTRDFFSLPPWEGYRLTRKRLLNLALSRYDWLCGRIDVRAYPVRLTLEPINACNLRCPACLTGMGEAGRRRSAMSLPLYRKLLAELGDYLFEMEFTNWGEPLLCEELPAMVREAHERGISTTVVTHLSLPLRPRTAEDLVAAGLTVLGLSIDGARQDSYEQYRVRGDLDLVLRNVRLVVEAKRRLGSPTPRVIWSFHAFPHNVADVEQAKAMAAELGIEFAATKGAVLGEEWGTNTAWRFFGDPRPVRCPYLWAFAVINNDGGVPPCQGAFYEADDMGRLAESPGDGGARTFMDIWRGRGFRAARSLFRRDQPRPEVGPLLCSGCPVVHTHHDLRAHLARGRSRRSFVPRYSTNQVWKFFVGRRLSARFAFDAAKASAGRPPSAA